MSASTAPAGRGRHRAIPAHKAKSVPADVRAALARAVREVEDTYDPAAWSFHASTVLVWVAERLHRTGTHDRLVIAGDCRTMWVTRTDAIETALGTLSAATTLTRGQIEMLLLDEVPQAKRDWFFEPINDLGWRCTVGVGWRRTRTFLVATNARYREVSRTADADPAQILRALHAMQGPDTGASTAPTVLSPSPAPAAPAVPALPPVTVANAEQVRTQQPGEHPGEHPVGADAPEPSPTPTLDRVATPA